MSSAGRDLLASLVMIGLAAAPAHATTPLEALLGDWTGRGQARAKADEALERVACRLTARQSTDSARIEVRGRCSGARGSGRFAIAISRPAAGGLTGLFTASVFKEAITYRGRETSRSLVFDTAAPIDLDGTAYQSSVDITFSSVHQFRMHETMTEAASGQAQTIFDMTYSRKR